MDSPLTPVSGKARLPRDTAESGYDRQIMTLAGETTAE